MCSIERTTVAKLSCQTVNSTHKNNRLRHDVSATGRSLPARLFQSELPTDRSCRTTLETPVPQKVLLLEGDKFCVSRNGISRTLYRLSGSLSVSNSGRANKPSLAVEELFDLKTARKTFVVREESLLDVSHEAHSGISRYVHGTTRMGDPIFSFDLQEIDGGVLGSAGTGATTWESSIAMSLLFSLNPCLLHGDVVELGSGVGLGGILTHLLRRLNPNARLDETGDKGCVRSMTFSDYNEEVLRQCERNVDEIQNEVRYDFPMKVSKLDWRVFVKMPASRSTTQQYHTVVASDCAYLYPDIPDLAATISALLRKDKGSKTYIFGPYNRGGLHELIRYLKTNENFFVETECVEMDRYRLSPPNGAASSWNKETRLHDRAECGVASKSTAKRIHIAAWHMDTIQKAASRGHVPRMNEID